MVKGISSVIKSAFMEKYGGPSGAAPSEKQAAATEKVKATATAPSTGNHKAPFRSIVDQVNKMKAGGGGGTLNKIVGKATSMSKPVKTMMNSTTAVAKPVAVGKAVASASAAAAKKTAMLRGIDKKAEVFSNASYMKKKKKAAQVMVVGKKK